jgi:SdrD B-like protein
MRRRGPSRCPSARIAMFLVAAVLLSAPLLAQNNSISGTKFNDVNSNGVRDPGDSGLAGVTIFLDLNHNGFLDPGEPSTLTAADGSYSFTNLGPGTYSVREIVPAGSTQTTANPADIVVSSGTSVIGVDFGNIGPPTATSTPTSTPTFTATPTATTTPTPTPTFTATFTPAGPGANANVPMLSDEMLILLAVLLVAVAVLLVRRG